MNRVSSRRNTRRKRNVLTIEKKLEIIKKSRNGMRSVANLANDYGIGIQTVRDILKQKTKLESFMLKADTSKCFLNRKTLKGSRFKDLDKAMAKWFLQKRTEGVPISGPMCVRQAQYFHEKLGIESEFCASSGWLYRFKKRHGIRELSIQGEKLSANEVAMVEFCYELETIIQENNLTLDQIYNADETGLYWRAMPTRTLAADNETSAPGFKMNKDRITILCCANASGMHKLRLAVIGKSKNPRAFKNLNPQLLPVDYCNQNAGWMTQTIFNDWFHKKFIPQVRSFLVKNNLPSKALLLLDNAPSHPCEPTLKSEDGNIFVAFFPPNVTSIAQPMDQGVIETMKRLYRKDLMMNLLDNADLVGFWKSLNVKDAVFAVARAWDGVKQINIKRAFTKIMTLEDTKDEEMEDQDVINEDLSTPNIASIVRTVPDLREVDEDEIEEWIQCDHDDLGYQLMTEDEMLAKEHNEAVNITQENSDSTEQVSVRITHQQANDAVDILLEYLDEQTDTDLLDIVHIRRIRERVRTNLNTSKRQAKLTDFFK